MAVFLSKIWQKMQRFIVLPVADELCRSRGVVSERPALPAGPSPQGTQFGNGSGPSNPFNWERWGAPRFAKVKRWARRRTKPYFGVAETFVNVY